MRNHRLPVATSQPPLAEDWLPVVVSAGFVPDVQSSDLLHDGSNWFDTRC